MEEQRRIVRIPRLQPASRNQLSLILDYMQEHDDFFQGKVTPKFTAYDKKRHWKILSRKLNSQGDTQGKSAEKWQRTWIDWRHSVKKKAKEVRRQKERGFQTKTLSALEVRALRMFRKLNSGKFDGELSDLDIQENEQSVNIDSETTNIQPVKIEDVLCISDASNSSSYEDFPSGASNSSPRPAESSSSVTSKTAVTGAIKATAKDKSPASYVVNSVYVVSTKSAPPLANKKAPSTDVKSATVGHVGYPEMLLTKKIKQEIVEDVDISDNTAISESSTTQSTAKNVKEIPPYQSTEESEEELESLPVPPKRRIEDTLCGLPLTLQNSILERLDTLNRNIETNTCALTILAKAVNDSAETNIRVVNHLAKSLNNIGNMVGSYLELLKTKHQEK